MGLFWLVNLPEPTVEAGLQVATDGPVMCMPTLAPGVDRAHCLVRAAGATVTTGYPGVGVGAPAAVVGMVGIARERGR